MPSEDWRRGLIRDFGALRDEIDHWASVPPHERPRCDHGLHTPPLSNWSQWYLLLSGERLTAGQSPSDETIEATASDAPELRPHAPCMGLLLKLDQASVRRLIQKIAAHLQHRPLVYNSAFVVWVFALLARVEKPLFKQTSASIRTILRWAATRRAGQEVGDNPFELVCINIVAHLIGDYFQQI